MVKYLPAMRETWVRSLGWEDPLEKEMATHSSVLAWRIPGTGEAGGLPSMGSHRVGHDWSDLAAAAVMESLNLKLYLLLFKYGYSSRGTTGTENSCYTHQDNWPYYWWEGKVASVQWESEKWFRSSGNSLRCALVLLCLVRAVNGPLQQTKPGHVKKLRAQICRVWRRGTSRTSGRRGRWWTSNMASDTVVVEECNLFYNDFFIGSFFTNWGQPPPWLTRSKSPWVF